MMITRHEGHGSFAKQLLKEGSMGGIMQGSHLHSHHAYSSGEILSPRSVLEQRALSGLAIAIDLEEKVKLSPHTQEYVFLDRFFSRQSIMHMSTQEAHLKENLTVGRFLSRERLNHMMYMKNGEREVLTGESSVGLKMVISTNPMKNQEGKVQENLMMGRSLSKERMRQMMHRNDEEEGEAISGGSNGGQMVGASSGGDRKQDNVCTSGKKAISSEDHLLKSPRASSCRRSSCKSRQSTWWLHELGHVQQSFPATMDDSIFYYAATNPTPPSSSHHYHVVDDVCQAYSPIEDFLQCCYFCKCRLGTGKDIYMYRGDQAFCSVECRYEQIAKDECMGASAL